MNIKLINPNGTKAFELKTRVKSAKLKLEFAEVESEIDAKIKEEIAGLDKNNENFMKLLSVEKTAEMLSYSGIESTEEAKSESAKKIGAMMINLVADKYKDERIIKLCRVILDGSALNKENKELFESDWNSDFWMNQDVDEMESLINSFRGRTK